MKAEELDAAAIIAGIDADGTSHIYTIEDPGSVGCEDGSGFAAIGEGHRHAEFVFMQFEYDAMFPVDRAMVLCYMAKKRAELAGTVGKVHTDFVIVRPTGAPNLDPKILDEFMREYEGQMQAVQRSLNETVDRLSGITRKALE